MRTTLYRHIARISRCWPALAAACWLSIVAANQDSAGAQESPPAQPSATPDQEILAGLERGKRSGEGLVILDAEFEGLACTHVSVEVGRLLIGEKKNVIFQRTSKFFGKYRNIAPRGLAAGTWQVLKVKCFDGLGSSGTTFLGPYAMFDILPGELVDAGTLKINYTRDELVKAILTGSATIRLSVQPGNEARNAELKKMIPRVMAQAKKKPMVLVGRTERKMKRRTLLD